MVALTDSQLDALDELAAQHEGRTSSAFERAMRSFHGWLAGLDLGDNEVLGTYTDPVFAGFVLAEEQPRMDDDKG